MSNLVIYGQQFNNIDNIVINDNNENPITFVNGYDINDYAMSLEPSGIIDLTGIVTNDFGFQGCSAITKVIGELGIGSKVNGLFNQCTGITTINIKMSNSPQGTSGILQGCTSLMTAVLITSTREQNNNQGTFNNCSKLEIADMLFNRLCNNVFAYCNQLTTIILRNSESICPMASIGAFNSAAAFKSGGTGGTIYIPKSLYDHLGDGTALDYKNASNWSTLDGYGTVTWAQIEGSYYETHYADGTLISISG